MQPVTPPALLLPCRMVRSNQGHWILDAADEAPQPLPGYGPTRKLKRRLTNKEPQKAETKWHECRITNDDMTKECLNDE